MFADLPSKAFPVPLLAEIDVTPLVLPGLIELAAVITLPAAAFGLNSPVFLLVPPDDGIVSTTLVTVVMTALLAFLARTGTAGGCDSRAALDEEASRTLAAVVAVFGADGLNPDGVVLVAEYAEVLSLGDLLLRFFFAAVFLGSESGIRDSNWTMLTRRLLWPLPMGHGNWTMLTRRPIL